MAPGAAFPDRRRWSLRDWLTATSLFLATAGFVLWQNSRLAIVWDLSYLLDSCQRIALGQHPYRDFPFVHPPLTFLLQAAILRLTGRVYFHHVLYAAAAGALATVLTWRIALRLLRDHVPQVWPRIGVPQVLILRPGFAGSIWILSLLLTTPLTVLGIYSIFPHPFYDCDCILAVLVAVFLLQRLPSVRPSPMRGAAAGVALVVPLFFKQNIGLPFLLSALAAVALLLAGRRRSGSATPTPATLLGVLAGALAAQLAAALLLHFTAGLHNYLYWTIHFAAQRRLPGLHDMLSVFVEPALLWQLPCVAIALTLLARFRAFWSRWIAFALLAAPFLWTLALLPLHPDSSDRADDLLALWPLLLLLAAIAALLSLGLTIRRRTLSLSTLLPLLLLATVFGTMLSQQLWGSTYALWPLLVLLVAGLLAKLADLDQHGHPPLLPALVTLIAATLLVCGGLYAASAERLSYAQLQDGPLQRSSTPALYAMATRGPWLPAFDQLLRFAAAEIPPGDGLLLLPGEDPFYFATGRTPRFPVLLFDNTTDPYSPEQTAALVRAQNIRWLIVKRNLQLNADPMPQRAATLQLLAPQFTFYRKLDNYDIYRRREP
jgi:hypothetical protein